MNQKIKKDLVYSPSKEERKMGVPNIRTKNRNTPNLDSFS
jgi:hypothetical protein